MPWSFLYKRSKHMIEAVQRPQDLLGLLRLPVYFFLDLVVFLRAQFRLARGIGTNYW